MTREGERILAIVERLFADEIMAGNRKETREDDAKRVRGRSDGKTELAHIRRYLQSFSPSIDPF